MLAIAFFAAQPVLAAIACAPAQPAAGVPECPMAMDGMGADCPMAGLASANECSPNCCTRVFPQALAPFVTSEKLRLALSIAFIALPVAPATAKASAASFTRIETRSASPPLYILNQVFRI
jgi:hypothetical protein